jgi:SAM-dependent methyltransferase
MIDNKELLAPACRICQSGPESQTLRATTVFGGRDEHNFWHCSHCDVVYLFPVPTPEEETRFYAEEFEKFMSARSGKERDWTGARQHVATNQDQVERRLPFLAPFLEQGKRLLEIGCSSGFMFQAYRERGVHCVGIEPSGVFFDFLRDRGHEVYTSIDEVERDAANRFDLVVNFFVLEHIRNPFDFITRSLALLRDGGTLILEVPCVNDPLTNVYTIPAFEKFYWSIAHHYYYSPKSLGYVLDRLGVEYEMLPEQRYDLSNHIVWMTEGKPGGQGKYGHIFSRDLIEKYKTDLKNTWNCDTIFLVIRKSGRTPVAHQSPCPD